MDVYKVIIDGNWDSGTPGVSATCESEHEPALAPESLGERLSGGIVAADRSVSRGWLWFVLTFCFELSLAYLPCPKGLERSGRSAGRGR